MKTDLLADRHIGIQEEDLPVMLEKIGVKSLDELINKTIPSKIRLKEPLPLAAPMTEREFAEHITELASQNKIYTSYIGMGWYDSITPAVIQRNVFENPVWYTSYTPYQTEVSQGRLEALMNFHPSPSWKAPFASAALPPPCAPGGRSRRWQTGQFRIQCGSRLIKEQDLRIQCQGSCDSHTLTLSAG